MRATRSFGRLTESFMPPMLPVGPGGINTGPSGLNLPSLTAKRAHHVTAVPVDRNERRLVKAVVVGEIVLCVAAGVRDPASTGIHPLAIWPQEDPVAAADIRRPARQFETHAAA